MNLEGHLISEIYHEFKSKGLELEICNDTLFTPDNRFAMGINGDKMVFWSVGYDYAINTPTLAYKIESVPLACPHVIETMETLIRNSQGEKKSKKV